MQRGPRMTVRDWSFMPGRRNRRRRRNLKRRIIYSDEGEQSVVQEINRRATGLRWKDKPSRKFKFVDDGIILTKVNMQSALIDPSTRKPRRMKHDVRTQNMFRRVVAKAEERGMVVNCAKTRILCISDAITYEPSAFFYDSEGTKLESGGKMKILGFHLDGRPSCHAHVAALQARMRETTWVLRHLKHSSFTTDELVRVYKTVVLPVLDYCCVVYHPMLTDEQDQLVERRQAQALKNIFGYKTAYREMRERAELTTHRARRIDLCDKFARKALASDRFCSWFPPRRGRQGGRRAGEEFQEFTARTDGLQNTPLFYFRRRLNGKDGKKYGERNRKYRED